MGGQTHSEEEHDCTCKKEEGEQEDSVKWCMVDPSIHCHLSHCMAWCTSQDGESGQCLHGIFKQMLMTSIGSLANMLQGGVLTPNKKESNIVRPI